MIVNLSSVLQPRPEWLARQRVNAPADLAGRKVFLHDGLKFCRGGDPGDVGTEVTCAPFSLRVTTRIFPHQHRRLLFTEAIDDQSVVMQHHVALLFEGWFGRDWLASQRSSGLGE